MDYYVALIFRGDDGAWGFTVPDLPGFTAYPETNDLSAAIAEAQDVLTGHIAATLDAGRPLPAPRDPAALEKDAAVKAEWDEAHAFVMLRAIMPAGRTLRVNISLDEAVLSLVDDEAAKRGLSRSGFIVEACRRLAAGSNSRTAASH